MKRVLVLMLVLSLCSIPSFAQNGQITKARCVSLEHVRGAWVMKVECTEGAGRIVASDSGMFAGDGIFSTWSQQKLGATYQSLVPNDDSRFELLQLG